LADGASLLRAAEEGSAITIALYRATATNNPMYSLKIVGWRRKS
jgi:hypothetical protein